MKKILSIIILGLILGCIALSVSAQDNHSLRFTDLSKPIVVTQKSPFFTITLQSNATTGFTWFLTNYDSKLVTPLSMTYHPPISQMVGAPGIMEWKFKVNPEAFIVPEYTTIALAYMRPWTMHGVTYYNAIIVTVRADSVGGNGQI